VVLPLAAAHVTVWTLARQETVPGWLPEIVRPHLDGFLAQSGQLWSIVGAGTLLSIALSQQDLANLIGASREIVSLTLSELRRRGLVTSEGRRLVVREDNLRSALVTGVL